MICLFPLNGHFQICLNKHHIHFISAFCVYILHCKAKNRLISLVFHVKWPAENVIISKGGKRLLDVDTLPDYNSNAITSSIEF